MPRVHAHPAAMAAVCVVACALIATPAAVAFAGTHERRLRILVFAFLTIGLCLAGLMWLHRRRFVTTTPATVFHAEPLAVVAVVSASWAMVIVDSPHATYFLLALIALSLWLFPEVIGVLVAGTLTLLTIAAQVVHHGYSLGALMGPALVALVMMGFMHMYRSMVAGAERTERLYRELQAAQFQLGESEREAGRLAERARLGRDLHDTVAQSLSSIQLLLQLAETDEARRFDHLHTAREAAAQSLSETRAFISALTPPDLDGRTLTSALHRVASRANARTGSTPLVRVTEQGRVVPLPVAVEATLLRIAQASVNNAITHANATTCDVTLGFEPEPAPCVRLEIGDDGTGFDVDAALAAPPKTTSGFGLRLLRDRARELGGYAAVVSAPATAHEGDTGTLVSVTIPLPHSEEGKLR